MSNTVLKKERGDGVSSTTIALNNIGSPASMPPINRSNEAALIERVKKGDEKALMQLVGKHTDNIFRKALSMVSNPEDAQDIVQEGLLSAFRAFPNFRAESGVYTWLYRIVVNKAKDHLSKRKVKKENLVDYTETQIQDDRINYQKNVELNEQSKFLFEMINSMEDIYRDILIKRYFDELSYQEISEISGINIGTVKSRLFKAKEILKKQIAKSGKGGDFFAL